MVDLLAGLGFRIFLSNAIAAGWEKRMSISLHITYCMYIFIWCKYIYMYNYGNRIWCNDICKNLVIPIRKIYLIYVQLLSSVYKTLKLKSAYKYNTGKQRYVGKIKVDSCTIYGASCLTQHHVRTVYSVNRSVYFQETAAFATFHSKKRDGLTSADMVQLTVITID